MYYRNKFYLCRFYRCVNARLWVIRRRLHIHKIHKNKKNFLLFQLGHLNLKLSAIPSSLEIAAQAKRPSSTGFWSGLAALSKYKRRFLYALD